MAAMGEDLERLKQRIPLLEYLQRRGESFLLDNLFHSAA
jgi:hypothetical protein